MYGVCVIPSGPEEYPEGRVDIDYVLSLDDATLDSLLMRGSSYVRLQVAATRLVFRHGYWFKSREFLRFVEVYGEPVFSAGIQWKDALDALDQGRLASDREAADVLRIAASIGSVYPVDGREVIAFISRDEDD